MLSFKQFLLEYLTTDETRSIENWNRSPEVSKHTDHFFGEGNDEITEPLMNTEDKSEIHRAIERHLGQEIPKENYNDGRYYNRNTGTISRLTQDIKDDKLKNDFKNDNTRKNVAVNSMRVRTTRSKEGIAGQSSHGQSWEQSSCKNFNTGSQRHKLQSEYQNGSVVSYLHDGNGKEIARVTFHPHIDSDGNVVYKRNSHYGYKHPEFEKHNIEMEKRLSSGKNKLSMYTIHPNVYNDSGIKETLHPDLSDSDIDQLLNHEEPSIRRKLAKSDNLKSHHIDKLIGDEDTSVIKAVADHKKLTSNQIDKLISRPNVAIRAIVAKSEKLSPEQFDKLLASKDTNINRELASNPIIYGDQIHKLIDFGSDDVNQNLANHGNLEKEHIDRLVRSPSILVRRNIAKRKDLHPDHIAILKNDTDKKIRDEFDDNLI